MRRRLLGRVAVARGAWRALPPNLRGALWVLLAALGALSGPSDTRLQREIKVSVLQDSLCGRRRMSAP